MNAETFIGRTIVGLEEQGGYLKLLRLDDGTAVEFAVTDYDEPIEVTHLTDEVIHRRALDAAETERRRQERLRLSKEAAEAARAHIAQMRKQLDPETFETWRRATYPTATETLRDVWTSPRLAEQFNGA